MAEAWRAVTRGGGLPGAGGVGPCIIAYLCYDHSDTHGTHAIESDSSSTAAALPHGALR